MCRFISYIVAVNSNIFTMTTGPYLILSKNTMNFDAGLVYHWPHCDFSWNVSMKPLSSERERERDKERSERKRQRERLLKSNSHDLETRCFVSKKELTGSKSVSGEPTESNYSQCCDISLQRTWKTPFTRPSTLCKTLRAQMINEKLTTSWPRKSTSSNRWQWRMAHDVLCANYFVPWVPNIFPRVIITCCCGYIYKSQNNTQHVQYRPNKGRNIKINRKLECSF